MRVFISSVITGYEGFRDAAAAAIESLGHHVIRAEDFGASPGTPQQTCLAGVRDADAVVLLVGARYGAPQPSGLSATDEEYREARETKNTLIFVEAGAEREPEQEAFLQEVQGWAGGHMTEEFTGAEALRTAVTKQLHRLGLSQQVGAADPEEMQARAMRLIPDEDRNNYKNSLVIAVSGGPRQHILRPTQIEDRGLYDELLQQASFGIHRVLDTRHGTQRAVRDDALVLEQENASVYVDEEGSVRVTIPTNDPESQDIGGLAAIIEEEIRERVVRALGYIDWLLDHIDETHRMTRVAIVAAIQGGGHFGWQTRAEHAQSSGSMRVNIHAEGGPVGLAPPDRARGALRTNAQEIAEDLTVRLRRKHESNF